MVQAIIKERIMQKNLVIVESPAKAKTIEKFLGKDFKVLSSYGHIRDLKKKEFSIDVEKNFTPSYEIPADKKALVNTLKTEAKDAETVWLASDEDREGEAIAWHLYEVLKLKPENTKRIVFHEITKSAILKAIEQPRDIDLNLVNAQQARRILDRIVGFELSPVLWRKVKPALSAGRVQSVAVRLIVEREREIHAFQTEAAYRITAVFLVPDTDGKLVEMKAELARRIKTKEEAKADTIFKKVLPEDLMKFGLIPEFAGRLPVVVTLDSLDKDALIKILQEPKNALIKQYQHFLAMDNVELEFEDGALVAIAEEALKRNAGARGLRSIIEEVMRNVMYEVPSRIDVVKCVVTEAAIREHMEPKMVVAS